MCDMTEDEVRLDFRKAFNKVNYGYELSGILGYGFDEADIERLAIIYKEDKNNDYRGKILDLFEDCNFHTEWNDFASKQLDKYILQDTLNNLEAGACAKYKGKYYIDSTATITSFFGIATDVEKLALVVYFTDILKNTATDKEEARIIEFLKLNMQLNDNEIIINFGDKNIIFDSIINSNIY